MNHAVTTRGIEAQYTDNLNKWHLKLVRNTLIPISQTGQTRNFIQVFHQFSRGRRSCPTTISKSITLHAKRKN